MARARGTAAVASTGATTTAATERLRIPTNGPHDAETLDAKFTPPKGTVDFGAVRVPVPAEGSVVVEPASEGRMQAVHVSVPEGRLSVSALAAPRNGGLWPDLAGEIDTSLREGGARVRSFTGEWGRELHATTDGATSVFVGVDGPRWMLYGVATGPTRDAVALDARLRRMLRGTVVVRGKAPYPVRTVLPLAAQTPVDGAEPGGAAPPTMTLRTTAAAAAEEPVNGASPAGTPVLAGLRGPETSGSAPLAAGTNGYPAAPNGVASDSAAAAAANAWAPTGGYPADATPALGAPALGASPYGAPAGVGTGTYGVPPNGTGTYPLAPNGTGTYAAPPNGTGTYAAPPNGTGTYAVPPNVTGTYAVPPAGQPSGSYAFGPGGSGTQQPGPSTNGTASYGTQQPAAATNGSTPYSTQQPGSTTNSAVPYGTQQSGAASNGATAYGTGQPGAAAYGAQPAASNGYGVPQPGSTTNGAPIYGAGPTPHEAVNHGAPPPDPTNGAAPYGLPPAGSATGATPYGVPQPPANGTRTGSVPPAGQPTGANAYGSGGYGAQQPGPAGTDTYGVPSNGTGTYGTATYNVLSNGAGVPHAGGYPPQPDATSTGAPTYGASQTGWTPGAYTTGSYGTGTYGVPSTGTGADDAGGYRPQADAGGYRPQADAGSDGTAAYGGTPVGGNAYGTGSYGVPQLGQGANGASTYGSSAHRAASADATAGEASGWKLGSAPNSTGGHSRPAVPPGWAHETGSRRRRSAAESEQVATPARPSEQAWTPSSPAEPDDQTSLVAPHSTSAPVEPSLNWRPSWADQNPRSADSVSASSDSALSDWRPSWADPEPAAPAPSPDPLFGPLTGRLDPLPEPAATWSDVAERPQRSAEPHDGGTPLFDAAYGTGVSAPVSGRRRRAAGSESLGHGVVPEDSGRARRRQETTDDRLGASASSRAAQEPRSGRRRAESAVEGRHDAGTTPSRHDAGAVTGGRDVGTLPGRHDANAVAGRRGAGVGSSRHDPGAVAGRQGGEGEARHAEPGNGYVAQQGTSHRVPPTQWAWPKEPAAVDAEAEESTGRRGADTGQASWSAAELVDSPGYGGRRRRSENGRHGERDDVEPGKHHRP